MLIRAYGLFWSADEVEWFPGAGNRGRYMFLGRQGERRPKLRLADFRMQSGLYIVYGDYGPYSARRCYSACSQVSRERPQERRDD